MRKGLRERLGITLLALLGLCVGSLRGAPVRTRIYDSGQVRLTVEITWGSTELPALPTGADRAAKAVELELTEGRVVEALTWPRGTEGIEPSGPDKGTPEIWTLGEGPAGRVRVRVEAPLGGSLLVRAGGQVTQFPIVGLLDGPQRTMPQSPMSVTIERLPWDALEVHLAEGDGTVTPGARLPVTLGFNILTAEPMPLAVRYSLELRPIRGGPTLARVEGRPEVVPSNALNPPARVLAVPMPAVEGTYLLEVRASWEPAESLEGSRLARLLKRRARGPSGSAVRRLTVAVLSPRPLPMPSPGTAPTVVDGVDFTRLIGGRPAASGRAAGSGPGRADWAVPEEALVEAGLRDRLRGWIARSGSEAAVLPPADPSGLAWSAIGLKTPHPGRPHRLTVKVAGGHPEALGVALVVPGGRSGRPRVLLDACASGPAMGEGDEPVVFSWAVWPDAADPVLVLVNRGERSSVRLASVELAELAGELPPATLAETHPESPRMLALHLPEPASLDRFGGAVDGVPADDVLGMARNLASYLAHLGASAVVLPDGLADDRRDRMALDGQAAEDALGPDRLALVLRVMGRRGVSALLETRLDGPLPDLPSPGSAEARERGLVRIDARGRADTEGGGPSYQPLHPEVAGALKERVASAIAPRLAHPNLSGLLIRLGPGATLPGGPESGLDDDTYNAFVRAMFAAEVLRELPGQGNDDPGRFAARAKFVTGAGRKAWLDWRSERVAALYDELADAVRSAAPGAILAVATPGLDDGPAGDEARRADRTGQAALEAWKAVGLDLDRWPDDPKGPVVLRGVGPDPDGLAHDLALSPELDASVAARPVRGLLLGGAPASSGPGALRLSALPMAGDEPLGHALAVLDPRWIVLDTEAVAGRELRVAQFARIYRSLPGPSETELPTPRLNSGVAVRSWSAGGRTYLALANDTPYEVLQEAVLNAPAGSKGEVDDLGRGLRLEPGPDPGGGRQLVLRLPPFGAAAVRVGTAGVRVEAKGTYLPKRAELEARAEGLSDRLGRLTEGEGSIGPPSPGFEPPAPRRDTLVAEIRASKPPPERSPRGWSAAGDPAVAVRLDAEKPHGGQGSLRLDARALPAATACDPFLPPGGTELTVHAWLRTDRDEARVRVWIEGEAAGRAVLRHADVPVGAEWAERLVRVPELPTGGLDRLRLRFEWLGPATGTLWVDDVSVTGRGPSESGRRVQQILTDALHAYRRGRFADFARLIASHRARPVVPEAEPAPLRTGQANDLPPGRRLR